MNQVIAARAPSRLRLALHLSCGLAALTAASAMAQTTAAADNGSQIDEIVITAERRETKLQETPLAVTALDGETIQSRQIVSDQDAQFSIPNVITASSTSLTVRGVGRALTGEQGVATYVNGVYQAPILGNEYYDIAQLELLRGPQGTLYGRNATAGVLSLSTTRPGDRIGGYLNAQGGNYNAVRVEGAIDLPMGPVRQRFAGYGQRRDGFINNVFNNNDIDGRKQFGLRSTTEFTAGGFDVTIFVSYFRERDDRAFLTKSLCAPNRALGCDPTVLTTAAPDSRATVFHTFYQGLNLLPSPTTSFYANAVNPSDLRSVSADIDPYYYARSFASSLQVARSIGAVTLKYVFGRERARFEYRQDYDNVTVPVLLTRPVTYTLDGINTITSDRIQISNRFQSRSAIDTHELTLSSDLSGRFNFSLGAYVFNADAPSRQRVFNSALAARGQALGLAPDISVSDVDTTRRATDSLAFYGQAYVDITPTTKLTTGARWTRDKVDVLSRTLLLSNPAYTPRNTEFKKWTGRVSLDQSLALPFTESSLLYASWARGYKAGGFNPVSAAVANPVFLPETLDAFEIGWKNTLADGRVQANITGFHYKYHDLQLTQRTAATSVTTNTDARINGLEFEFQARPTPRFAIDANLALLDAEVVNFISADVANPAQSLTATTPVATLNLSGNKLPYAPDWSFKIGGQYTADIGSWASTLRIDYFKQGAFFAREYNTTTDRISGWSQLNARLSFARQADDSFEIGLFVKNLTNSDNITGLTVQDSLVGRFRNATILDPRTWGVSLSKRF